MKKDARKPLPWPVLFAMYRAVLAPRIFVKPGGHMRIELDDKCELHPPIQVDGARHNTTIEVMYEPGNPGELTIQYLDPKGTP